MLRQGCHWSLLGDRELIQQLQWDVGAEIDAYDHCEKVFLPFSSSTRFRISRIGTSLWLKKPGVVTTPLLPILQRSVFEPVSFPSI